MKAPSSSWSTLASPNVPMKHPWVCGLRVGQREEDWIDLVDGEIGIAADLELDDRRVAVLRDLTGVLRDRAVSGSS